MKLSEYDEGRAASDGGLPPKSGTVGSAKGRGSRVEDTSSVAHHASRITFHSSRFTFHAFTLLEVMIACGLFFMATFAILELVSNTLRNARSLQRGEVDAGMAAAQVYQTLKTTKEEEGSMSGDFGDTYPEYYWDATWGMAQTNGLLTADILVSRRGARRPVDALTIWVYSPNVKTTPGRR